ncbi:ATP-dependent nuclease [Methylobacterium sp. J-068]|uniref:ATP-dependent nuclease n=1 Tax=Methylobacterium sp. J-068 TaxID=2836649 RepID=UPI001FBB2DFC|nr:AAA family ATPase [Methylobacterium sp. J-068]MCJ2035371.1 AAA family ATPase [Methylobacterium sp. J-068]
MKLEQLHISNFKGLKKAEVKFDSFDCLVGENNSGKSSVLQSVVWALGRSGTLPTALYYDQNTIVEFNLVFIEIDSRDLLRLSLEQRDKIQDLIIDGKLQLRVKFPPNEKCETLVLRRTARDERLREPQIAATLQGKRGASVIQAVQENYPEFAADLPQGATATAAKAFLKACISALPEDQHELTECPLPTGISSSITNLLPEPIYIPAVKNLIDDLKTTQSTPFGRLMGLLLEGLNSELSNIQESLTSLNRLLNRIDIEGDTVDGRHDTVKKLEETIEGFLQDNFPSIKLELNVPPPEIKTILSAAQIYVDDGSRDLIDNKGDGIKRSLTFALLQTYVQHRDKTETAQLEMAEVSPSRRPLMFLFEEPELYLHPRSQRILFKTLAKISISNQVIVTTHSPIFFEPGVTASFIRVSKETARPKSVGRLYPISVKLDPDNAEVFRLTKFENTDAAFFSRGIILFEGESDDFYCKHTAKILNEEWCFDSKCVSLVRVSGKGNFAKFRRFYEAFGLPVKIVADLDAIFDGYQHLGAPADLNDIRSTAVMNIDARVKELKISAEPNARKIKDKVHTENFKIRYNKAKLILREVQKTGHIRPEEIEIFDELFTWEQDIARINACREDDKSRQHLLPLLDGLRAAGICVLSRGAIEDYYPDGAEHGQKPQRALLAVDLIKTKEDLSPISRPLEEGRACELTEIFTELFRSREANH